MTYIEKLNNPTDLKKLSVDEMEILATEIRDAILNRNSIMGGHVKIKFQHIEFHKNHFIKILYDY